MEATHTMTFFAWPSMRRSPSLPVTPRSSLATLVAPHYGRGLDFIYSISDLCCGAMYYLIHSVHLYQLLVHLSLQRHLELCCCVMRTELEEGTEGHCHISRSLHSLSRALSIDVPCPLPFSQYTTPCMEHDASIGGWFIFKLFCCESIMHAQCLNNIFSMINMYCCIISSLLVFA